MSEVKPCPMCGGEAESRSGHVSDPPASHPAWTVKCIDWKGCGVRITASERDFIPRDELQQTVEARWNRRDGE